MRAGEPGKSAYARRGDAACSCDMRASPIAASFFSGAQASRCRRQPRLPEGQHLREDQGLREFAQSDFHCFRCRSQSDFRYRPTPERDALRLVADGLGALSRHLTGCPAVIAPSQHDHVDGHDGGDRLQRFAIHRAFSKNFGPTRKKEAATTPPPRSSKKNSRHAPLNAFQVLL
jgi:hypothetical protein